MPTSPWVSVPQAFCATMPRGQPLPATAAIGGPLRLRQRVPVSAQPKAMFRIESEPRSKPSIGNRTWSPSSVAAYA